MKKIVCVLVMMIWSVGSWATKQKGDILLYKGETYELRTYCLELYFSQNPQINTNDFVVWSTNLWRGYIATFEIIEDTLYLTKIEGRDKNYQEKNLMKDIFPNEEKVKVDWLAGIIQAHDNSNMKNFEYGQYLLFELYAGSISEIKKLNKKEYKKFKNNQLKLLKHSIYYDIYIDEIKEMLKNSNDSSKLSNKRAMDILDAHVFDYLPKFLTD